MIADLQPLGRCEERHADGIVNDGIHHRARIDDERIDSASSRGDGAGKSDRTSANNDN
jgi:hypothetical protein